MSRVSPFRVFHLSARLRCRRASHHLIMGTVLIYPRVSYRVSANHSDSSGLARSLALSFSRVAAARRIPVLPHVLLRNSGFLARARHARGNDRTIRPRGRVVSLSCAGLNSYFFSHSAHLHGWVSGAEARRARDCARDVRPSRAANNDPCICAPAYQDSSGRGRPNDPRSEQAAGEQGSPRPLAKASVTRTVDRAVPQARARIGQGRVGRPARSRAMAEEVYVGIDVSKAELVVAARRDRGGGGQSVLGAELCQRPRTAGQDRSQGRGVTGAVCGTGTAPGTSTG